MNMQSIMAQAQKMQRELEKVSKEIEETIFEGNNGIVKVKVKGNYKVLEVLIDDSNTKNVNIHQTITNEADIKRAENEVELEKTAYEAKQKRLEYVGLVVVCLVIFALLGLQMILG